MSEIKFGSTAVKIDKQPDLKSEADPYVLSVITRENRNYKCCKKCVSLHNGKYKSCSVLDVKRIPKKDISKAKLPIFIRDALQDGYCVILEYSILENKYKSMIFSIYTSLIRNSMVVGYDIHFDIIGFNDAGVYEVQKIDANELFKKYEAINNGEITIVKATS